MKTFLEGLRCRLPILSRNPGFLSAVLLMLMLGLPVGNGGKSMASASLDSRSHGDRTHGVRDRGAQMPGTENELHGFGKMPRPESDKAVERYIRFGPFRIDQQRQEVTREGSRLKLQGKVYQILLILLERPGEVVTREELRSRLWPADTHVNYDANVNTAVNKLRQALGDSSDNPVYIETIPRKGYCLLAQPEISDRPENSQSPQTETSRDVGGESHRLLGGLKFSQSDLWIVLSAFGLILAGMLLGAGIMRLWMNHAASVPARSLALILSHFLERAVL